MEQLFGLCNNLALLSWVALFIFYKKKGLFPALFSIVIVMLALLYSFFIFKGFDPSIFESFGSLAGVMALFTNPEAVMAGWIHYLAFDLFVGMWEAHDSIKHGISRWLLLPCLLFTFMFGPFGLLLYFIVRSAKTSQLWQNPYSA
jgi:hypothetical protein